MSLKKVNYWKILEVDFTSSVKNFRLVNEWYFFSKYWGFYNTENVCLAQLSEYQYRRARKKFDAEGAVLVKKETINEEKPYLLSKSKTENWNDKEINPVWLERYPVHLSLWWTEKGLLWVNNALHLELTFEDKIKQFQQSETVSTLQNLLSDFSRHFSIKNKISQSIKTGKISTLKYWKFYYSRKEYGYIKLWFNDYKKAKLQLETAGAGKIGQIQGRTLWWSNQGLFWADSNINDEEIQLLLWDRHRKHGSRLDRLRKIRDQKIKIEYAQRERIPDEVRSFVWERDEGRCVKCGSQEDLQFDHIIPVAKNGGNSIENIQILCGDCNRQKRDNII